jgi:hypothetical protein
MKYSSGKIYQYSLDGMFINEFENLMDVQWKLKISSGTLSSHLTNKSRHCHGYLFSRKYYLKYPIAGLLKKPNKKMIKFEKEFYSYDTNGIFLRKYFTLKDVSERNDIRGWVRACLKGENKTYDNKIWLYEEYKKIPDDILNNILNKRIVQINENGCLVEIYKNISEAARKTGFGTSSISLVVAGKRNSIYGNKFKRYSKYKIWQHLKS